nr:YhcG family protein [Methanoplanus limicola]
MSAEFGRGFSMGNLRRMIQFSEVFPDEEIVASLMRQLSWTHFTVLIPIKNDIQRDFYSQMCRIENWSVRTLRKKIDSMLFERTAISKKPDELIKQELEALKEKDEIKPCLVLKDPYLLDFLDLSDTYSESDLEQSILREIEHFVLELGSGFTFIERQKRMIIDGEDHYLDLLFYHRRLKRLVAIELKIGKFKAGYKGQPELYLRWLEKYEMIDGEKTPLGIILCSEGKKESIELLELNKSGIHVAEYLTELLPPDILKQKLDSAIANAKNKSLLKSHLGLKGR